MKIVYLFILIFLLAVGAIAQQPNVCPVNFAVCLNQEQANKVRDNALELQAQKEKVSALEDALKEKDKSYLELKAVKDANEKDLREAIHRTEIELSLKTGQSIEQQASLVRMTAIIEFLLKNGRVKKNGIINLF